MNSVEPAKVTALVALVLVSYYLPTLIAISRHGVSARRVMVLNATVGWTVAGWVWALVIALKPADEPIAGPAETAALEPGLAPTSPSPYEDGSFLISQAGAARTWAVHADGRWGVVYELDGTQRASSWVDSDDIPFDVLARALHDTREARR